MPDKNLISLTHTCHSWRERLVACPSLWTRLDFTNVDKTRVYIERAKTSPLEFLLHRRNNISYLNDAFLLVVPHIGRLRSISIVGAEDLAQHLTEYLSCPIPLLEDLAIDLICDRTPALNTLFSGNISSLRTLKLTGFMVPPPWMNPANLTTFILCRVPDDETLVTRLLDFFDVAPLLSKIALHHSLPTSSDTSPKRLISLPHLKELEIVADPAHSILLNHLPIPFGTSLIQRFGFTGNKSPLPDYLPGNSSKLKNVLTNTAINLCFDGEDRSLQLHGSGGVLYIFSHRNDGAENAPSFDMDDKILHSMDYFACLWTQRLAITKCKLPTLTSAPHHLLDHMKYLRTLTLIRCNNLPFILALNPEKYVPVRLLCPKLEKLVLYVEEWNPSDIPELLSMVKKRDTQRARLQSMTIVSLGELAPRKEVFKLREFVTHMEYRFEEKPPKWDDISDR